MRKIYLFCLNSLYSILGIHFLQHADAEINVLHIALALCEKQLISVIFLVTFMSVPFFGTGQKKYLEMQTWFEVIMVLNIEVVLHLGVSM